MNEKFIDHRHMERWTTGANMELVQDFIKENEIFSERIKVADALRKLSMQMEPMDKTLGQDGEMLHYKAFFKGLMAGIGFAREAVEDDRLFENLKRKINKASLPGIDITDVQNAELLQDFAERILASGHEVVDSFPALKATIDSEFIDYMEPSVKLQYHARAGVGAGYGYSMLHIYGRLPRPKTVEQLATEAQSGDFDWDSALQEL